MGKMTLMQRREGRDLITAGGQGIECRIAWPLGNCSHMSLPLWMMERQLVTFNPFCLFMMSWWRWLIWMSNFGGAIPERREGG